MGGAVPTQRQAQRLLGAGLADGAGDGDDFRLRARAGRPREIAQPCKHIGNDEELAQARRKFERDYLISQISRFSGNISRTAEFVGMERSALHRKLKALGVG